jgi:DNA-binding GntR family transcriptional regulator
MQLQELAELRLVLRDEDAAIAKDYSFTLGPIPLLICVDAGFVRAVADLSHRIVLLVIDRNTLLRQKSHDPSVLWDLKLSVADDLLLAANKVLLGGRLCSLL